MHTHFIALDHQKLAYYESQGAGPSLVLVHGNSCSGEAFRPQLEGELGKQFHLLAFDLPGHGQSDPAPDFADYSMAGYAKVLNLALAKLNIENAVLAGWSLGGHIVLEMSPDAPGVKGVMVFGTPPLGFPPDMENAFLPAPEVGIGMQGEVTQKEARTYATSFFRDYFFKEEAEGLIKSMIPLILKTDPNARLGLGQNLGPDTYLDEVILVKELKIPLAVFHGRDEKLVNLDYIRALDMPTLWRNEVQVIKDAGHAPQLENTSVFDRLLAEFIEDAQ